MRRASLKMVLIAGALIGAGVAAQAQVGGGEMSLSRSRDVQAIVANIDANKSAAVNQLLTEWQANLDPTVYDVWAELSDLAMKAPAWQIYAAALTGDFNRMTNILLGRESAGKYINALSAPQPKVPMGFGRSGPMVLGDTTQSLVYTPIAPCRVVDTRGSGARTGVIPANGTRSFDLESDALSSGQGGAASCAGLPNFSYYAWAVNITVTNSYVAAGGLKAWGFSATEPNASIINFGPASAGGIANGLTLTGCYACGDDITIRAFGDATHVIIDVIGYYQPAAGTAATVTRLAGTTSSLGANARAFFSGAACPTGTRLLGGEVDHNGSDVAMGESRQSSSTTWTMWMINNTASATNVTVYSRCMDTPLVQ